ncbi:MAG: glycosyltransferase [Solirubrobacteraceae bacterium]
MNLCTIIAKNYLAQARVLARSFREHHPDGRCFVLIVDETGVCVDPAEEPFEVLTPSELELDRETFLSMATIYDVLELSTSLKPSLLQLLVARLSEPVLYLDPDIQIFSSLEPVHELAAKHGLVLTPHVTAPLPRDGRQPGEVRIVASGAYNLGFVAVGPGDGAAHLLRWWSRRLRHDCIVDTPLGLFVDQRWFDMAPSLMEDFHILRDPGYNVAYWNLATRQVQRGPEGGYTVNGEPLRFFHFSGYDPSRPYLISEYQDRHSLAEEPVVRELFGQYGELVRAAGFEQAHAWGYDYDLLPDGSRLWPWLRRTFRMAELTGELERSAFTPQGLAAFYSWLREPAGDGAGWGVNRYLDGLHASRGDLRVAYPDLSIPEHAAGLVDWAHVHGAQEVPIPEPLLPPAPSELDRGARLASERSTLPPAAAGGQRSAPEAVPAPLRTVRRDGVREEIEAPWGVNVAGYLRSELGVAEAARLAISALDAAGVPVMPVHGSMVPGSRQGHPFACVTPDAAPFAVNLICVNADRLPGFVEDAGPSFFAGRYQIGMWWWEVSTFPERWRPAFGALDELWVATRHIANVLSPISPVPVIRVPIPVSVPPPPARSRGQLGLPDGFVFLFLFDFNSSIERKNPHGLIEAFKRAFAPSAGASLVLKAINGEQHPHERERLRVAVADRPDVHLLEGYLSAAEKNAMIASADCYVSLHRSEGLGLTLAEAMYLGTPVIATAYSGNLDFMTDRNGYLVPCELCPIGAASEPYPAGGQWADPDLDTAAAIMRRVIADPAGAAAVGRRAASEIRDRHSPQAAGRAMRERLDAIRGRVRERGGARPAKAPPVGLDAVRTLIGAPLPVARSRPARIARRAVERVARQRIAHQRRLDQGLSAAISALSEANSVLERSLEAERLLRGTSLAQALAELRRQERVIAELAPDNERLKANVRREAGLVYGYGAEESVEHEGGDAGFDDVTRRRGSHSPPPPRLPRADR